MPKIMPFSIFAAILLISSLTFTEGFECLQCASELLRDKWQMTSLPNRIPTHLFDDKCAQDNPTTVWNNPEPSGLKIACSSVCVTMLLQEAKPNGDVSPMLVVRGCHDNLVGKTEAAPTATCQRGTIQRVDANGLSVSTAAELRYCNVQGALPCNTGSAFTNDQTCSASSSQTVACYMCNKDEKYCDKDSVKECTGHFCAKAQGYIGRQPFISKTCSPFNPYGSAQSSCRQIRTDLYIPSMARRSVAESNRTKRGITFNYDATHCFCNTGYCNTAVSTKATLITVLSFLPLALFTIFYFK